MIKIDLQTRMSVPCLARVMRALIKCNGQLQKSLLLEQDYIKPGNTPVALVVLIPEDREQEFREIAKL